MTKQRSIFGFMFHMTNLWQVNGNGNLSRSDVTAMVKSTGHIIVTSVTVEMNLHNLDQSSSVSSFTLLYKRYSRASQFQDVLCMHICCRSTSCAILTHHPRAVYRHFSSAEVQGSIRGAIPKAPVAPRTWVLCDNPLIKEMGELVSEHRDVCQSSSKRG